MVYPGPLSVAQRLFLLAKPRACACTLVCPASVPAPWRTLGLRPPLASLRTKQMPWPGYTVEEQNQHLSNLMAAPPPPPLSPLSPQFLNHLSPSPPCSLNPEPPHPSLSSF